MKEDINNLIIALIVIKEFSKDIHYTTHGEAFFAKHLLVDKFNFDEYIDTLKECSLLGENITPKSSKFYLNAAQDLLVEPNHNDDKANFEILNKYLEETLEAIKEMSNLTKADENIVGTIAQDLQQYKGLINLQLK